MIAIAKKEFLSFFSSPNGYLVIGLFLSICGLLLWVFPGTYNILDNGFADLNAFFALAPWVLLFLVAAVSMRVMSEEYKLGTIELLLSRPISVRSIVLGKFLGVVVLMLLALLPTVLYIVTIDSLAGPAGNLDIGSTLGSYIGLAFLTIAYSSIGIYASSLSQNQVVAFLITVLLCIFLYIGLEGLSELTGIGLLASLGIKSHFDSLSRGVIDSRDLVYFVSVALFFLALTVNRVRTVK